MLCIQHPSNSKFLRSEPGFSMTSNATLLLIFVTLGVVTAQTFQYSRGWTNGKRDGHKLGSAGGVDKILNPCQILKLKYLLEGKPYNDRLLIPCDYSDEEGEQQKRYKFDHSQEALFDAFQ